MTNEEILLEARLACCEKDVPGCESVLGWHILTNIERYLSRGESYRDICTIPNLSYIVSYIEEDRKL